MPLDNDIAYARFEQACSMEQSYFAAAAETIGYEMFIKPYVSHLLHALPFSLLCPSNPNFKGNTLYTILLPDRHITSHQAPIPRKLPRQLSSSTLPQVACIQLKIQSPCSKKGLGTPDPTILTRAEFNLDTTLRIYNIILSQQKYLAGDSLTLADLFHLPNGAALMAGKWAETFNKYEHVERWFKELQGRESWVKAAGEAGTIV